MASLLYGAIQTFSAVPFAMTMIPSTIIGVLPRGFRHPGPTISGDVDVFGAGGFSADPLSPPIRGNRVLAMESDDLSLA